MTIRIFSDLSGASSKKPMKKIELEPELEGPARPTAEDILKRSETNPELLRRNRSKEIQINLEGMSRASSFYDRLAYESDIPVQLGMSDVLNACILDAMSLVLNKNIFSTRKRPKIVSHDEPPLYIEGGGLDDEQDSARMAIALKNTSIVCKEQLGTYTLNIELLMKTSSFFSPPRYSYVKDSILEKEINHFFNETLVPKYLNFYDASILQPFLEKYKIKKQLQHLYRIIIDIMRAGMSSIRCLPDFILFPFRENFRDPRVTDPKKFDKMGRRKTSESYFGDIGVFVVEKLQQENEKLQQGNMMPTAMVSAFRKDKYKFIKDLSIVYAIYFASKTVFDLLDILQPSVRQIIEARRDFRELREAKWKIKGLSEFYGDFTVGTRMIIMIALIKECIHKFNDQMKYLNARVKPDTTLIGFLKSIPDLDINKIETSSLDRYLKQIVDYFNYQAWTNNQIYPKYVRKYEDHIGLAFVKDEKGITRIQKTEILNKDACVLDPLKSNLKLLDKYFIPSLLISYPRLTNMDVFRKIYLEDDLRMYNAVEQSSRRDLRPNQIKDTNITAQGYTDYNDAWAKGVTISALDMIYSATLFAVRNYALKTCNVLKKNEKTKINLLRSEITSESGVAIVGKIVMASAIVYAVTRMFKSKKVKSKK
jgi:hypothetical protein